MKQIGRDIQSSLSLIWEKADDIIFTPRICQSTESGENEKKIDLHEYDISGGISLIYRRI